MQSTSKSKLLSFLNITDLSYLLTITAMSVRNNLDDDIVWEILSFVDMFSLTVIFSLADISLTSQKLYAIAQPFLYRTLCFAFVERKHRHNQLLLQHVLTDATLHASVREVQILWFPSETPGPGNESQRSLELLTQLIPRLNGLKWLVYKVETTFARTTLSYEESRWDNKSGFLPSLLYALHLHHPYCRLDVSLPYRQDLVSVLALLVHSPCLYSLTTAIDDA